jgi:hypothetical protein
MTMYLLQIYIGFYAMEGTMHLDLKAACSVLTLATLAMIATPNGIGTFPIFVKQTLLLYGIAAPLGQAFGSLLWGVSTGLVLMAGGIALILLPYLNRKKHEISPSNPEKINNLTTLIQQVARWRLKGKKIAFTNGVFDILHEGHIASLF